MNRAVLFPLTTLILCFAYSSDSGAAAMSSQAQSKKDPVAIRSSEIQSPIEITYRVIGTPIIGSPVAVDLTFRSTLGDMSYTVTYRVNDPTAMQLPEGQSDSVTIAPTANNELVAQQVTVIPLREGRLYLNVAAVVETEGGSMQTVTAVPVQVGPAAQRQSQDTGTVVVDDDGNLIRSLPAKEN